MEPILKVSGLTKTFSRQGQADFTAVKNISFDLFPGECLAIIGESGSGKTTAVNMIARLVDVTSGSIFLDTSSKINHEGVRQFVSLTRRNYSDAELSQFEQQGSEIGQNIFSYNRAS